MHTRQDNIPMTQESHVDYLLNYLLNEGFSAIVDADGDITFKFEGLDYALCFDEDDADFAKIILPNIWQIKDQSELNQAMCMLDNVNRKMKVVKGYTTRDTVWFAAEVLFSERTQLAIFIKRIIRALAHAGRIFAAGMLLDSESVITVA
ncbi:hypothetical protein [Undibacterium sp. SXout20W]|uniref:hypothetical protein n=1 Tax=Undibacterium sp. SXout20W TaxID=3413051 RepID=UPI003BF268BA